jgi:hypothetical protein
MGGEILKGHVVTYKVQLDKYNSCLFPLFGIIDLKKYKTTEEQRDGLCIGSNGKFNLNGIYEKKENTIY